MRETKEDRFRRVAEARVNKIIAMLRLLGNCSRKGNYLYTREQVEKIFTRLQAELDRVHKRYQASMDNTRLFSLLDDELSSLSNSSHETTERK